MAVLRRIAGVGLIALGLWALAWPSVSVWRLSDRVLDEAPTVGAVVEDRHRLALFDSSFVLAERTYVATSVDDVVSAARADGFARIPSGALAKACCGHYGAVELTLEAAGQDTAVDLTVLDDDIRAAAPMYAFLGLVLASAGAIVLIRSRIEPLPTVR